jgi:hypothetical protein
LPADLLAEPKPLERVYCPAWLCGAGQTRTLVEMRNASSDSIAFKTPIVLALASKAGDRVTAVGAPAVPTIDAAHCPSPLGPSESCPLEITFAEPLWPGEYALDFGVAGQNGGWSQRSVKISVRHSFFLAFLVIAAGVGTGWLVQNWRSSGRRAFAGLLGLAQLRDRLRRFGDASGAIKPLRTALDDQIAALEAKCQAGADITADLDKLGHKVDLLAAAAALEGPFSALPAEGRTALAPLRAALLDSAAAAGDSDKERTDFDAQRRNLGAAINDWGRLETAARKATGARDLVQSALLLPLADASKTKLLAAAKALADAAANATVPLDVSAGAGEIGRRADALTAATTAAEAATQTALQAVSAGFRTKAAADATANPADAAAKRTLAELDGFDAAADAAARISILRRLAEPPAAGGAQSFGAPAAPPAPGAAAPLVSMDAPVAAVFDLSLRRSVADIRKEIRFQELVTNLAVLGATCLAGVVLLASNPTWGAGVDVITAFLGGFGARTVLGEVGLTGSAAAAK